MRKERLSVNDNYDKWWKELLENEDGSINKEQLKKELSDFSAMIENIPEIFCHVTGGMVSKHLTDVDVVCNLADEHYAYLYSDDESEEVCMHDNCLECGGTGTKKDGSMCAHYISCSCPKCRTIV